MPNTLALIGTYQCNLRCRYCPVGKSDGRMSVRTAERALELAQTAEISQLRLAGADPFMHPRLLEFLLDTLPAGMRLRVTTNGLRLDADWISRLQRHESVDLVISVDGDRDTHLSQRLPVNPERDGYVWFTQYSRKLARVPGITVNMVIAPENAEKLVQNVAYLSRHGFFRLNLLPAYYLRWSDAQLDALDDRFRQLAALFERGLAKGLPWDIVNVATHNPVALYRQEWVVDTNGDCFDSDIMTAQLLQAQRAALSRGNIHQLDSFAEIDWQRPIDWRGALDSALGTEVMASTDAVDDLLTRFVRRLARIDGIGPQNT